MALLMLGLQQRNEETSCSCCPHPPPQMSLQGYYLNIRSLDENLNFL